MSHSDEVEPLLENAQDVAPASETSQSRFHGSLWIVLSLSAVMLLLDMSNFMAIAPGTAILEDIACKKYYASLKESDGERCKIEPVQSEVALINAWREAFEIIPGILCAVPYGALADRIGRKKVLLLSLVGCFLSDSWTRTVLWFPNTFPTRAIWFSGLWQFLGGGATTINSMLFVMVADVCPVEKRTTAFSQIHAAFMVSELLSVPIGAALMTINPWVPYLSASAVFLFASFLAIFIIPETFPIKRDRNAEDTVDENVDLPDEDAKPNSLSALIRTLRKKLSQIGGAGPWIKQNGSVILVLTTFFVTYLGRQAVVVLLQYASLRCHWNYVQASYLLSLRAGVSLIALTVFIPTLSILFIKYLKVEPIVKDKRVTQISGLFLVLGSLTTFLATSPALLILGQSLSALGFTFVVTARSLITVMVEQKHRATLYTGIAAMTYCGMVVGGPLLAKSFSWGMKLGDFWLGLPFLVASGLFLLATAAVSAASTSSLE